MRALLLVAALAHPAPACPHGRAAVRVRSRPVCVRVLPVRTQAAVATYAEHRLLGRRPRISSKVQRAFDRARRGLQATAARSEFTSEPVTTRPTAGSTVTSSSGQIGADPGEAGDGNFHETTETETKQGAERETIKVTKRIRDRTERFGPMCPDYDGVLTAKVHRTMQVDVAVERRGKRYVTEIDMTYDGTLVDKFDDRMEPQPIRIDSEFEMQNRTRTEIAATGKVIDRQGTRTERARFGRTLSADPESIQSVVVPQDSLLGFGEMNVESAQGPKGPLSLSSDEAASFVMLMMVQNWFATVDLISVYNDIVDNMKNGKCVAASASPAPLVVRREETATLTATAHGKDDGRELPAGNAHINGTGGAATVSPDDLTDTKSAIGQPAQWSVTTHAKTGTLRLRMTTRRGIGFLDVPWNEPAPTPTPTPPPKSYSGPFSGTAQVTNPAANYKATTTFSGSMTLTPGTAGGAQGWTITGGQLDLTNITGTAGDCTIASGGGSYPLPGQYQSGGLVMQSSGGLGYGPPFVLAAPWLVAEQVPIQLTGGDDCKDASFPITQFGEWLARSQAPITPDANGHVKGTAHDADDSHVTDMTWDFSPQ